MTAASAPPNRPAYPATLKADNCTTLRHIGATLCTRGHVQSHMFPASTSTVLRSCGGFVTDGLHPRRVTVRDAIADQVIECLYAAYDLRTAAARTLLAERFSRTAGQKIHIPDYELARDWLIAFVEGCARLDGGVPALVATVRFLRPQSPAAHELCCLLDEWDAVDVALAAPDDTWDRLRAELDRLPASKAAAAYRQADLGGVAPPHCRSAWHLLAHAAARPDDPRVLPRWLVFLIHAADLLTAGTAIRVEQWHRRFAFEHHLTRLYDQERLAGGGAREEAEQDAFCLVIQFEPTLAGTDAVLMKSWYQWPDDPRFYPRGSQEIARREIESATDRVLADMERHLTDRAMPVRLEIILPLDLINTQVETWLRRSVIGPSSALVVGYPVVIRCLERLQRPELHRQWRLRWNRHLTDPPEGRVLIAPGNGSSAFANLSAHIAANDGATYLILSAPPAGDRAAGQQELRSALVAGLPVVAWHRVPVGADDENELRSLFEKADPARLPGLVRSMNLTRLDDRHESARIAALLFDDPTRQPEGISILGARGESDRDWNSASPGEAS